MFNLTKSDRACLLICATEMLGVKKRFDLYNLFDDIADIFDCEDFYDDIVALCGEDFYSKLVECISNGVVDKVIDDCSKLGITPICYASPNYPDRLKNTSNPPLVIFCKGRLELLDHKCTLGVVGTRRASRYGADVTRNFCRDLSTNGVCIISGMAKGIDGYAHESTLAVGGDTIAVVATGVDKVYPSENRSIYDKLIINGLVISEYLPGSDARPYRFPERNRIVVALSDGVLVVEAGEKSGALITLDIAIDEGKDCFIVPHNLDTRTARGSNDRLRSMPDALVLEPGDILSRFGIKQKGDNITDSVQLDFFELKIVETLELGERHFDELLELLDIKASELTSILTRLELVGVIKDLGGNYYGV